MNEQDKHNEMELAAITDLEAIDAEEITGGKRRVGGTFIIRDAGGFEETAE